MGMAVELLVILVAICFSNHQSLSASISGEIFYLNNTQLEISTIEHNRYCRFASNLMYLYQFLDGSQTNKTVTSKAELNQSSISTENPSQTAVSPAYEFSWELPKAELDYWDWFEFPEEVEAEPPGIELLELEPQEIKPFILL